MEYLPSVVSLVFSPRIGYPTSVKDEYLGPMPCVAAFRFTKRNRSAQFGHNVKAGSMIAEIEFWDSMLQVPWIADSIWNVEAAWDQKKKSWFIVDRSTW